MKLTTSDLMKLEQVAIHSWPALEQIAFDGWLLRFSSGFTGRANSVNPLEPSTLDLAEKIQYCEQEYRKRCLPIKFRLTPFFPTGSLEEMLSTRGYAKNGLINVMYCEGRTFSHTDGIYILDILDVKQWIKRYYSILPKNKVYADIHKRMLLQIETPCLPASITVDGMTVAMGFGVLHDDYFGLFNIATHPKYRRRGYAWNLVKAMMNWALNNGAGKFYLQVDEWNKSAIRLYQKSGFHIIYDYWYWEKNSHEF